MEMASNVKEKEKDFTPSNRACENIGQSAADPIACLSQAWDRRSKIKSKIPMWLPEVATHLSASAACIRICLLLLYLFSITRTRCTLESWFSSQSLTGIYKSYWTLLKPGSEKIS